MKNKIKLITMAVAGIAITVLSAFQTAPPFSVHLEATFTASPSRVYNAFMDKKEFTTFTGKAAEISKEEGAPFLRFNRAITGRNIELKPGKRIILTWRPHSWPPGAYSIVKIVLEAKGARTLLILDQTGIPTAELAEVQKTNWPSRVFIPLANYLK